MQTIRLAEALKIMEATDHRKKPVPFDISFFTADLKRQTAGEFIELKQVVLSKLVREMPKSMRNSPTSIGSAKLQNHWKNSTRNIYVAEQNRIIKLHIRLIYSINDMLVTY